MHKLETGQAALLGIGGQGHVTPAYAADVNAFLIIASFILQTQSIVDMCFLEAQRQESCRTWNRWEVSWSLVNARQSRWSMI